MVSTVLMIYFHWIFMIAIFYQCMVIQGFIIENGTWIDDWKYDINGLDGWDSNLMFDGIFHGMFGMKQGFKRGFQTLNTGQCILGFNILFLCHIETQDYIEIRTPQLTDIHRIYYNESFNKLNNSEYLLQCHGNGTYFGENDAITFIQIEFETKPLAMFWISFRNSFHSLNEYFGISNISIQCIYEYSTHFPEEINPAPNQSELYLKISIGIVTGVLLITIGFCIWYFKFIRPASNQSKSSKPLPMKQNPPPLPPNNTNNYSLVKHYNRHISTRKSSEHLPNMRSEGNPGSIIPNKDINDNAIAIEYQKNFIDLYKLTNDEINPNQFITKKGV